MDKMRSFDEAVQLVTKDPQQVAFGFNPARGNWNAAGSPIFAVEFVEDVDEGASSQLVNRRDGMFHSNSATQMVSSSHGAHGCSGSACGNERSCARLRTQPCHEVAQFLAG